MLSDSEASEVESLHHLTINEHYAKAFEYKKEREELQKLKDKYGSDFEEDDENFTTDSESDQSEDEYGEELTPTMDAAIFRTLARIKRKDPEIYDTKKGIFDEEQKKVTPVQNTRVKNKSNPVTIRQVALESALNPDSRSPSPVPLPHVEEQRALRDETIAAFHQSVDDQDNDGGFFVPREKTQDEQEREEEEYKAFLEREVGSDLQALVTIVADDEIVENSLDHETKDAKKKQRTKKTKVVTMAKNESNRNSKQESDQEFLMNYIMNRGWIDRTANHIPTYREVLSSKSKGNGNGKATRELTLDSELGQADDNDEALPTADPELDDDDFEEIVDRFESSYNFRFEEPDAAVIKSYPRNLSSLVRREDTTRKELRERRKQRKEEELLKKREEVKLLKKLKMKEIYTKWERIGREGGKNLENNPALQNLNLDGEWDPVVHDRQMAGLYEDSDIDDEKPHWDEDIDIDDIIPDHREPSQKGAKKKKKKKKNDENDELGVDVDAMNADVDRQADDEEWDGTEEMRKKKLDEYMDEIYGLDFNDMVGDLPTRFKYVPVQPQSYSLTPVEVLLATDQELNEYMSVKKYAPYRKEARWDSKRVDRLKEFKNKISERIAVSKTGEETADKSTKKRKGKKERSKLKAAVAAEDGDMGTKALNSSPGILDELKREREYEDGDDLAGNLQESENHGKKRRRKRRKLEKSEDSRIL